MIEAPSTRLRKKIFHLISLCVSLCLLSGCLSSVWTVANLAYDRHNVYKKINDFTLKAEVNRALYQDSVFKRSDCSLDVTVFNGDILVTGHVPNDNLRQTVVDRVTAITNYRRLFNQISLNNHSNSKLKDAWITTKLHTALLSDSSINPQVFKLVCVDSVVYLMGDVLTEQANKVIYMARRCRGVQRVVCLLKYYQLSDAVV